MAEPQRRVSVELEPIGRRARVPAGTTVLQAARSVGVPLASVCGGHGTCGRCRVRVIQGAVGAPSSQERGQLSAHELAQGVRLACQTCVEGDLRIDIPPDSLTARQRLQLEGEEPAIELDPAVVALDVELAPPALDDLRADATRLLDALAPSAPTISLPALTQLPKRLRAGSWSARVALDRPRDEIVAVLAPGRPPLGLAVDVGTTKLAAYLVDLTNGQTLARAGAMNPQIAHGEDVLRRIAYAGGGAEARATLQHLVVDAVNRLAGELAAEAERATDEIVDCVVVGNTAMHHLFTGLPVRQLGQAPYVAASAGPLKLRAAEVGLRL
ncbi:MAG TPA: 2Fe-2S iron-sulfur cluster-binding protein, partial [Solirubrobacteraceae bacterium]|nr:2Fe-2S iron-sulfur cluster-binding protein [Solirubrobacteraceae bacterium]